MSIQYQIYDFLVCNSSNVYGVAFARHFSTNARDGRTDGLVAGPGIDEIDDGDDGDDDDGIDVGFISSRARLFGNDVGVEKDAQDAPLRFIIHIRIVVDVVVVVCTRARRLVGRDDR
jgi:hypothetical protein